MSRQDSNESEAEFEFVIKESAEIIKKRLSDLLTDETKSSLDIIRKRKAIQVRTEQLLKEIQKQKKEAEIGERLHGC